MSDKLEAYLEEIGHYLAVREERAEILSEIRSHIFEKAEREYGETTPDALEKTIAGYGPARRVAERYLDGQDIIAPAYKRYLFRYTALLFAVHLVATAAAVVFRTSFYVFPLLFVPRMGVIEALMYLPTALLCDFGITALVLFLITRSRRNVRLPWPKFAVDIDEVRPPGRLLWNGLGFVAMLALTGAAFYLYTRHHTIFFANLDFKTARPLFTPQAGRWFSLTLIALWAVEAMRLGARMFTGSRWVDVAKNGIFLVILGLLLGRPLDDLFAVSVPAGILPCIRLSITVTLLIIAVAVAVDLVKSLVIVARRRLEK
jgi:hypothetical protein